MRRFWGTVLVGVAALAATSSANATAAKDRIAAPAEAKKDADGFVAEIVATGTYKANEAGKLTVKLTPKAGYHIDAQFPIRWKASDAPPGVAFDKKILKREDGAFTESEGSFAVAFTASKAGKYTLGGTLSLSVCNDKSCVMEKVPLDVEVDVR